MKRFFLFLALIVSTSLAADEAPARKKVTVNNRVLATVNGKVISVVDVMKKMDMLLYQNYPQYLEVPEARYEFYTQHWKEVMSELIDRQLMMADAEEKNFPISSGDVREELEEIFGPEVMINLDNAGLTLDEAWEMVKADIIIRRILYYRVRMPIQPQITPNMIRKAYEEFVQQQKGQKECLWQCVTIKHADTNVALASAQKMQALLVEEKIPLEKIQDELKVRQLDNPEVQIIVSQPFRQKQSELSQNLQELLLGMQPGSYSSPQLQSSRSEQNRVVRIYYVHEITAEEIPSLQELEQPLRDDITHKMTAAKTGEYLAELRRHFHCSKEQIERDLPANYQPFALK